MSHSFPALLFFLISGLTAFFSFYVVGPYNLNIDAEMYLAQITQFEEGVLLREPHDVALRAFKPLYGVWGALVGPLLSPVEAIQILNLIFLFALPFVVFLFLKELGFKQQESTWGALWVTAGYPVLKYGLAISTDIAGWFFAALTAYFVLLGVRTRSLRTLILASLIGFIGGTAKEPGMFGLIFGGFYILFTSAERKIVETVTYLAALSVPAFLLEVVLVGTLVIVGFPTFLDWYGFVAVDENFESHYTLLKLIAVLGSTFSLLLLYALVGAYAVFSGRLPVKHAYAKIYALLLASLPVLLWTIFISRVLYIQYLIVVPLALWGASFLVGMLPKGMPYRILALLLYTAPIAASVTLFALAGKGSLFDVFF